MAHATVLLAVTPGLTEGISCPEPEAGRAPVARLVQAPGADSPGSSGSPDFQAAISAVGETAGSAESPVVIVVGADLVGFRRVSFPFRDARRIRQALRFALESELLDGVDSYVLDHELIPNGDGAYAHVSLLKQEVLRTLLTAVQGCGLVPHRVLSAPHALLAAQPPASPNHLQVYVGAEETFLILVREGMTDQIKVLPSSLAGILADLSRQDLASPTDVHRLLTGEADESRVKRGLLRGRLVSALEDVAEQIGGFLRVQGLPATTTVSVHGLYAPWIEIRISTGEARFKPKAIAPRNRRALGMLEEVRDAWETLVTGKGPGFYWPASSWRSLLKDARRPLIALGVLVALVLGVSTTTYTVRTVSLLRQLDRAELELQGLVTQYVGASVPESARASVLRERLETLREQSRAARTGPGPYGVLGTFSDVSVQATTVAGVTVESLQIAGNQVVMTGQTPSYQAAETLRDRLNTIPRFRSRTVKVTYQRAGQGLVYRVTVQ